MIRKNTFSDNSFEYTNNAKIAQKNSAKNGGEKEEEKEENISKLNHNSVVQFKRKV